MMETGGDHTAVVHLHAQALCVGVTAVPGGAAALVFDIASSSVRVDSVSRR